MKKNNGNKKIFIELKKIYSHMKLSEKAENFGNIEKPNKKYKLLKETGIEHNGRILYRIEALKDFGDVKKGDIGGGIASEKNLSQEGNCGVSDEAKVYDGAIIGGYAQVYENAQVYGCAYVYENANIFGYARIFGFAQVFRRARVFEHAQVWGHAKVWSNAEVFGCAKIFGEAGVHGNVHVFDEAQLCGQVSVGGNKRVFKRAGLNGEQKLQRYDNIKPKKMVWEKNKNEKK